MAVRIVELRIRSLQALLGTGACCCQRSLALRTRDGIPASDVDSFGREKDEFIALGLLRESNGNFVLTRKGKTLADSVAEAFL